MIEFQWNELKSKRLKKTRGVSFEEILIEKFISFQKHPVQENQEIMLFVIRSYIWGVRCVRTPKGVFLKTLYPSRHWTKKHRRGEL